MFPAVELNFPNPVETLADLFDRDAELELVLTALRSPTRRPIVIMGERVMGKTSLLNVAAEAAAVMPEPRAIVTAGDFAGLLSDSYATVELPDELRRAVVAHVPGDPPEPWQLIEALCALTRPAER